MNFDAKKCESEDTFFVEPGLFEVWLGDGILPVVIEDHSFQQTRRNRHIRGWSDQNTQVCELCTKRIFLFPAEVCDAKVDDDCGSSETPRIIMRPDQLARMVVDGRCENKMGVDDCRKLLFSRWSDDRPLLNFKQGTFDVLRGRFLSYLWISFKKK